MSPRAPVPKRKTTLERIADALERSNVLAEEMLADVRAAKGLQPRPAHERCLCNPVFLGELAALVTMHNGPPTMVRTEDDLAAMAAQHERQKPAPKRSRR